MKHKYWPYLLCAALLLLSGLLLTENAQAGGRQPVPSLQDTTNETCLGCHSQPGQTIQLQSGEQLYISVDPQVFDDSVHGRAEVACVECHTEIEGYPHPPIEERTRREFSVSRRNVCANCHEEPYEEKVNDAHTIAMDSGNLNAPVCSDCHGSHDITEPDQPRSRIPQTCQRCHSQIYELYKDSVHGEALLGKGNPDVPSCVDCHNAHNVQGPTNTALHLFSPQVCARCHADQELMAKYGVNTDVFDTYLADFHGTTITLYQATVPGQEMNKPVCVDCHSVHDIQEVNDPESSVIKQNILRTCRKCHPDATENFPAAWLSHYPASPEHAPTVFFARLFYTIMIPVLIGGMFLFVASDFARRRFFDRRNETDNEERHHD